MLKTFLKQFTKNKIKGMKVKLNLQAPTLNIAKLNHISYLSYNLYDHKNRKLNLVAPANTHVKKGDVLAQNDFAKVLASADGIVTNTNTHIILTPDSNEFDVPDSTFFSPNLTQYSSKKIMDEIQKANIEGLGGALFSTYKKASAENITHIVLNGVECEPIANADEALMLTYLPQLFTGALLLQKATNATNITIVVKANKYKLIKHLKQTIKTYPEFKDIKISKVPDIYPAGAAKQIINFVFGEYLDHKTHASSKGYLVQNVMTAWSVYNAVIQNAPQVERIISIFGKNISNPTNMIIPIGAQLADVTKQLNIKNISSIRTGGFMMGENIAFNSDLSIPIQKNHNSIIFNLNQLSQNDKITDECINCGACVNFCPLNLSPQKMLFTMQNKDINAKILDELDICMYCNLCSYVCPSNIDLTGHFKQTQKTKVEIQHQQDEKQRLAKLIKSKQERLNATKKQRKTKNVKSTTI